MQKEVQLTDGSVLLRPYRPEDVAPIYEAVWESIAELSKWMAWAHAHYSVEETGKWIESCGETWANGTECNFVVTDAKDGSFLGGCGLNRISHEERRANLGYWVGTSHTGQGIATAAALLVARFGFGQLQLQRIEITAATDNKASQRVAEKVGAARDRILAKWITVGDRLYDAVVFSLTPADLDKAAVDMRSTQGKPGLNEV
jgi:ribosomal-protein-serine acetyltransferase